MYYPPEVDVKIYIDRKWVEPFSRGCIYYDDNKHKFMYPTLDDVTDFIRQHPGYRIYVNKAIEYSPGFRSYIDSGWGLYEQYDTYDSIYYQGEKAIEAICSMRDDGWTSLEGDTYPCEIDFHKVKGLKNKSYRYTVDLV